MESAIEIGEAPLGGGDERGDDRHGEVGRDAAGDDAEDGAEAAQESVAPALAQVDEQEQHEQHVDQAGGDHAGACLRVGDGVTSLTQLSTSIRQPLATRGAVPPQWGT